MPRRTINLDSKKKKKKKNIPNYCITIRVLTEISNVITDKDHPHKNNVNVSIVLGQRVKCEDHEIGQNLNRIQICYYDVIKSKMKNGRPRDPH